MTTASTRSDNEAPPWPGGASCLAAGVPPTPGAVLEDQSLQQHAGDGAFFLGQFADRLEVALQVVGDGPCNDPPVSAQFTRLM